MVDKARGSLAAVFVTDSGTRAVPRAGLRAADNLLSGWALLIPTEAAEDTLLPLTVWPLRHCAVRHGNQHHDKDYDQGGFHCFGLEFNEYRLSMS